MPAPAPRVHVGAPAKPARATTGEEQTAARNQPTDKPEARRSNRYPDVNGQIVRHGVVNPKKAAMPVSAQATAIEKKADFSQLRIKRPMIIVGAVNQWRSLEEIAEALHAGNPVSGEEQIRLRAVGAKV